jgi:hypothetical protein
MLCLEPDAVLRISEKAESTTERLLHHLDEQGLVVSSQWLPSTETSIAEVLWPQVRAVWTEKQEWLGCRELAEEADKVDKVGKDKTLFECV